MSENHKNELTINPNSPKALKLIIELLVTNAWSGHFKRPTALDEQVGNFIDNFGDAYRTQDAKEALINLVGNLASKGIRQRAREKIQGILNYSSIQEFTNELYELAVNEKTKILGEKGKDAYLRDFGHWDRIPIDKHETRFIVRTGIYHTCSKKGKNDFLKKAHLHDSLTKFCSECLNNYIIDEINLGKAPGIIDVFIWTFCAKEKYNICGSVPKCNECQLRNACLFSIINGTLTRV